MRNPKKPEPYWDAESQIITFRAKTLAKAVKKAADYCKYHDLSSDEVYGMRCDLISDSTVTNGECHSVSITL